MPRVAPTALLVLLAACAGDARSTDASADSALARDLALAGQAPPASVLGDTALSAAPAEAPPPVPERAAPLPSADPAPRVATPRAAPPRSVPPPPPAPAPAVDPTPTPAADPLPAPAAVPAPAPARTLGAGTTLVAATDSRLCARTNRPGDKLVATLREPVTASDGSVIAAGTPVVVEVAAIGDSGLVSLRARAISVAGTSIPLEGAGTADGPREEARIPGGSDKGKVVTGAVIGAIAGRILGRGTGATVIGAAAGAAAGTAAARRGAGSERCLSPGATVRITLAGAAPLP